MSNSQNYSFVIDNNPLLSGGGGSGSSGGQIEGFLQTLPSIEDIKSNITLNSSNNPVDINDMARRVIVPLQFQDTDSAGLPTNISVLVPGKRRTWFGDITITDKMMRKMVRNFNAGVGLPGGTSELDIDFEHKFYRSEAAAWVRQVSFNDNTLVFSDIEWTDIGAEAVLNRHYRYISSEFYTNYMDVFITPDEEGYENEDEQREYGPTITAAGLTNRPALTQLPAIMNSDNNLVESLEKTSKHDIIYFGVDMKDLVSTDNSEKRIEKNMGDNKDDKKVEAQLSEKDLQKLAESETKMENFKRMLTTERITRLKETAAKKGIAPSVTNTVVSILGQLEIDAPQNIKLSVGDEEKDMNMFEALTTVLLAMPKATKMFDKDSQSSSNDKNIDNDDDKNVKLSSDSLAEAEAFAKKIGVKTNKDNPYMKIANAN